LATKKKSPSKQKKSKQNSSIPQPKLYPLSSKKPTDKKNIFHAVGVIKTEQESQYHEGVYQKFPKEIIQSHIPQYNVVPYSNGANPRPLSAAQINTRRSKSKSNTFFPKFFMNPYQDHLLHGDSTGQC